MIFGSCGAQRAAVRRRVLTRAAQLDPPLAQERFTITAQYPKPMLLLLLLCSVSRSEVNSRWLRRLVDQIALCCRRVGAVVVSKALKSLAARNAAILNRTHLISLGVNGLFLFLRLVLIRRSFWAYTFLAAPALAIQFWFERIGRPTFVESGNGKELKKAGEDLEAKGLTEWMWDVVYWTWGVIGLVTVFGDRAWWLYIVVPLYSAWLAYSTFTGARQGLAGLAGNADGGAPTGAQSKRQQKMEKRGGQRVQYR
ncbi:hypothetical protein M8818_004918 [Zalaria obscura]|uniref:Uncharacterized protein n=1 Tax=Zalaria obscura TaxID=2024903 RepID=A0ACC3SDH9_9PEZI